MQYGARSRKGMDGHFENRVGPQRQLLQPSGWIICITSRHQDINSSIVNNLFTSGPNILFSHQMKLNSISQERIRNPLGYKTFNKYSELRESCRSLIVQLPLLPSEYFCASVRKLTKTLGLFFWYKSFHIG